jgi:hypothetical protein
MIGRATFGILLEIVAELLVDDVLDQAAHVRGAELRLGLPSNSGCGQLHRDHRGEALARVVARQRLARLALAVLRLRRDVAVERARERGAEADQVAAALDGVDVVRERVDRLVVALVVLDRDLDRDRHFLAALVHRALARHEDRRAVQRRAVAVQVLDERDDPALVAELVLLSAALVADVDAQPGVQERQLAQALGEHVELVFGLREDRRVGQERDARAGLVGGADLRERLDRLAAAIGLAPHRPAAPDLELELLGQRVHHRHADAVQAARDLVGAVVELPPACSVVITTSAAGGARWDARRPECRGRRR